MVYRQCTISSLVKVCKTRKGMLEKRNRNVGRTSESKKTSIEQFSIDGKPKLSQRSITTKVNVTASQRGINLETSK